MKLAATATDLAKLELRRESDALVLVFSGSWSIHAKQPDFHQVEKAFAEKPPTRLVFETNGLKSWDSGLMTFLQKTCDLGRTTKTTIDYSKLPEGAQGLMRLAEAVPEKETGKSSTEKSLFYRLGSSSLVLVADLGEFFTFIGETTVAFGRFLIGRARMRWSDVWLTVQQVGPEALPIVALISFLVGLILGFVGAVQLQQFGASIYVANLVGLAMVREMGAMMAGIIMCGRTGAAFAAQLGSMKVSEEIDALQTLGLSPIEFLVLPRMLALILMMPLLVLFADFVGIIGGLVVSLAILDITFQQYVNQTIGAIDLTNFSTGIIKSTVFGVIVAVTGCLRGMQCGDSSASVGLAATSAVVTGITGIIVADAIFAVVFNILGM
ncbi:ABC transporter permease [Rubellicoccus peritrichatus]|uniref:ABC transporter permease n=1 Tax=Rubellicoccus peritrichatus TaxID=3080537 RepID=A0AAQ3QXC1_9BACT|nr:ABC transporter permease [Puniceicoccus sp. CR14]WOO42887.1 ABC transporter permease [Puniceicoccus sp. CR14]